MTAKTGGPSAAEVKAALKPGEVLPYCGNPICFGSIEKALAALREAEERLERAGRLETACRWLTPGGHGYGDVKAVLLEIDSAEKK